MMPLKRFLLLMLTSCRLYLHANALQHEAVKTVHDSVLTAGTVQIQVSPGSALYTDYLEHMYVVSPDNDISKYDKTGKLLATANFKVLGNISSIDAGNPFELYVFYRDQNRILFLDNMLNLRGECDLETIGVSQIACLARSADNQIWLFDMADLKLKKYSKDLKLIIESAPLNTLVSAQTISPAQIMDINSSLLMLNSNSILEFDIFANFGHVVLYDTMSGFQYNNGTVYFFKNGQIHHFNTANFKSGILNCQLPEDTQMVRIEKETVFILKDRSVILQTLSEKH